jgi:hypothetical protein
LTARDAPPFAEQRAQRAQARGLHGAKRKRGIQHLRRVDHERGLEQRRHEQRERGRDEAGPGGEHTGGDRDLRDGAHRARARHGPDAALHEQQRAVRVREGGDGAAEQGERRGERQIVTQRRGRRGQLVQPEAPHEREQRRHHEDGREREADGVPRLVHVPLRGGALDRRREAQIGDGEDEARGAHEGPRAQAVGAERARHERDREQPRRGSREVTQGSERDVFRERGAAFHGSPRCWWTSPATSRRPWIRGGIAASDASAAPLEGVPTS